MKTTFSRQFGMIAALLLLCMGITGVAFRFLMLSTIEEEKEQTLTADAQAIATLARAYNSAGELEDNWDFRMSLSLFSKVGSAEEPGAQKARRLTFDKLIIDLDSFELIVDGKRVETPPKEMELLYHLASSPNRVFTRNQLLDEVWGFDYFGDSRTVDVHIKRLREKLEGVSDQWSLKTVWGVGYKFEVL